MTCPHKEKRIDGVWWKDIPGGEVLALAWSCLDCRTSGATPWGEVSPITQSYGRMVEESVRPTSPEMMVK